ncbi:MAG: DUF4091 domain-containing protein, partial [Oscillospiraceae bacterium]
MMIMLFEKLDYWFANALDDVFFDTVPLHDRVINGNLTLVKNEREAIQLVFRTNEPVIEEFMVSAEAFQGENAPSITCNPVGMVFANKNTPDIGQKVKRCTLPGLLPEYLARNEPMKLSGELTKSYFITIETSGETMPGIYRTNIVVTAEDDNRLEIPMTVRVADVTIPNPEDSETDYVCWINLAGLNGDIPKDLFAAMNHEVFGIENYSEEFWQLGQNYAKALYAQRQNCVNVPVYALIGDTIQIDENGKYIIDWTNFDRYCKIFIEFGHMRHLTGMHLFYRDFIFTKKSEIDWITVPLIGWYWEKKSDGKIDLGYDFGESPKVMNHLKQFLPMLNQHLEETGLKSYWLQHVADETTSLVQQEVALQGYRLVKQYLPGVRTIDAGNAEYLDCFKDYLDIHTIQLESYHKSADQYTKALQQNPNLSVYTYTCINPRQDHLSRLGDYKLICTRLIFYYNFKHNVNGYLHWAWNLWSEGTIPNKPFENGGWGPALQVPTDAWMVYPDAENLSVLESSRSYAIRDGLEDWEILKIAHCKNPQAVD